MSMIMDFCIMARMVMIVWSVFSGMFMVVRVKITAMDVLVEMVMRVGMGVLVGMLYVSVKMFMRMKVSVFVRV
jgi:hypothetical protein